VLSGFTAAAYFIAHAQKSFFPILNQGELAVLYCFVLLYLAAAGVRRLVSTTAEPAFEMDLCRLPFDGTADRGNLLLWRRACPHGLDELAPRIRSASYFQRNLRGNCAATPRAIIGGINI
jgi:hypothetical protein